MKFQVICYIIGILLTFIIVSLIIKKENNVNGDVWLFITVVIGMVILQIHQIFRKSFLTIR